MVNALPCIVCGREIENLNGPGTDLPKDGVEFVSTGNYGSTVFDPGNGDRLKIVIHDTCLVKAAELRRVFFQGFGDIDSAQLKPWDPDQ